jgi:AmmeMemoRadiSam system protein B
MLNKKYLFIISIVIVMSLWLVVVVKKSQLQSILKTPMEEITFESEIPSGDAQSHLVAFEDRELFFKSVVDYPKKQGEKESDDIAGGIIPHHLLPSFIIADFFSQLANQDIETLILVGPNHYERGDFGAITSRYNWETPLGFLEPNIEIIDSLEEKELIKTDEAVIALDHSITAILPFVQYYLPKTKVVPLILSKKIKKEEVDALAEELKKYTQARKVVIVASVDFSHYLTNLEAKEKNEQSLEAIRERSYDKIFAFGNEHVDSPASIVLLLKNMDAIGAKEMTVLHDTNSGEMLGDNFSQITSYLSLFFSVKK